MDRIFSSLAVVALLLLLANLYLGLTGGDVNGVAVELKREQEKLHTLRSSVASSKTDIDSQRDAVATAQAGMNELQPGKSRHIMLGLLAAVVTLIVNSISVTYFIGTGRWCSEVAMTYELDPKLDAEARQLKRKTFPWSLLGIATVLLIAALGAAADPGTLRATTAKYVVPHYLTGMAGIFVIAWSMWKQYGGIQRNSQVIDRMMDAVRMVRTEKGLDVEPVAQTNPREGTT